ncbi:MAG: putative PEP-binding protein [Cyanobacteria bacterium P01_D01_bin.71]
MSPLLPLDTLAAANPRQIGETAYLLHQLQQSEQTVPQSWVIPAEYFQQVLQRLVARDPLYADWPQLLWQSAHTAGYSLQHLAKRLYYPLLNLSLNFPWSDLLNQLDTPVVRLMPSLWCGDDIAMAPWAQMLESRMCWADPEALETALKQLWMSALNAKSLVYWSQWRATQSPFATNYPAQVELAVVIQRVEAARFSGTLTVRDKEVAIAAVEGLHCVLAESCPATFAGTLPRLPHFPWQSGYQEQRYTPRSDADIAARLLIQDCFQKEPRLPLELTVPGSVEQRLWTLAQWFTTWSEQSLRIEWSLASHSDTLQVLQLYKWPLRPFVTPAIAPSHAAMTVTTARGASPGKAQGRALILSPEHPLPATARQQIIVASEVSPEWLPLLKTAAGVISEQGGLTCHAAVLARELGLPAIVGVVNATRRFRAGDALEVDGDRGLITPLPALTNDSQTLVLPKLNWESTATEIWVNLSQPDTAAAIAKLPVAGVGILRSEWLMLPVLERQHPYHWMAAGQKEVLLARLMKQLRPLLSAFAPRPVRYRTLDLRTSEFAQLVGAPPIEPNPMLGVRGTFSYQHQPAFFELELELLKRLQDEGYGNLQLLLPFVRTVEEVMACRERIAKMGLSNHPDFALWMMAEVPSVLFLLPQFIAAGVEGIAIGTHDLTQLLLGIDREQALFTAPYNEAHPAVRQAIAQLIQAARQAEIDCCLCGVSPIHHPEAVAAAVQQQVTGLSVDVSALELTVQLVQKAEAHHAQ